MTLITPGCPMSDSIAGGRREGTADDLRHLPGRRRPGLGAALGARDDDRARQARARLDVNGGVLVMATLDVRPMIAAGKEPFDAIMAAVGGLGSEEELELFAPLDPIPLYQVLSARGFTHETESLGGGDYRVVFRREVG